ncbi:MAG: TrkA family potassium uptake protein [Chloroflexota bacterium]|nr:TrkA family potassium uptake protein [Chloroflexota bacterium]
MNVVILGCGRVGSTLARSLDRQGHAVTVLEWNEQQFARLGDNFSGATVLGNGIDADALRQAGIELADVFVAVTNGDNRNIMAAQIAREVFQVRHVIMRVYDPVREQLYRSLGLDTVCPTTTIAGMLEADILSSREVQTPVQS